MTIHKPFGVVLVLLTIILLYIAFPTQWAFALSWTCPYCGETFNSDPRYPEYFEQWKQLHMSQCPKRPGGGSVTSGSAGSAAGAALGNALYQSSYQLGNALGRLIFGDPQAEARRRAMSIEAAQRERELEQQRLIQEIKEKQEQYDRLASEMKLDRPKELAPKGFDGNGDGLIPKGMDTELTPKIGTGESKYASLHPISTPDSQVKQEQDEFEQMNAAWMKKQQQLIQQRLDEPNRWCSSICASLKTKEPPLPGKGFNELQPGDVLLICPDGSLTSKGISLLDGAAASHTLIYLKEVNGKKLFLDNVSGLQAGEAAGVGPHIITGEQYLKLYGQREANVATLTAQPLNQREAAKLWAAARELGIKELSDERKKSNNWIDKTDYGLYGNDNMVCSEASRWALIKAGRWIQTTRSPLKKLAGVDYSPADFFSDDQNFLITPLR